VLWGTGFFQIVRDEAIRHHACLWQLPLRRKKTDEKGSRKPFYLYADSSKNRTSGQVEGVSCCLQVKKVSYEGVLLGVEEAQKMRRMKGLSSLVEGINTVYLEMSDLRSCLLVVGIIFGRGSLVAAG
jgi:hypothetical protein